MKGQKKLYRKIKKREFKKGKLTSGNSKKKVKKKQAIAIALSEAMTLNKKEKMMKPVPAGKKGKGLRKLPKAVRNKMGFMKKGGRVKKGKSKWLNYVRQVKLQQSESSKYILVHMQIFGHLNIAKAK